MSHKILVVDDNKEILEVVKTYLDNPEYNITTVESGVEAIEKAGKQKYSLVLCDLIMPELDGIKTMVELKKIDSRLPVIMMSGLGTHELIIEALEKGASDFVAKPINWVQIRKIIENHLNSECDNGYDSHIRNLLRDNYICLLNTFNSILEAKDPYLKGHSSRVSDYAMKLAELMKLDEGTIEVIICAAQLHDIGKVGVSDVVLLKADKLNIVEYDQMKMHSTIGYRIIEQLKFFRAEEPIIRHHHERYDGGGYPDGLMNESIPLGARIIGIADAYDAMTSARPYRKALSPNDAKQTILNNVNKQFDPKLARLFINHCT